MIAVVDYGMGNLRSVEKALQVVGAKTKVTSTAAHIRGASHVVFPGVGAFGEAMRELKKLKLVEPIKDAIYDGKPFLGLCLGLQLLFERSEEAPGVKGLCVLEGSVRKFKFTNRCDDPSVSPVRRNLRMKFSFENFKVPHMGWNTIQRNTKYERRTTLLKGIPNNAYMYFVHSYYVAPKNKAITLTTTDYGIDFVSGIAKGNIYGLQFHPEKSQAVGLEVLRNFVNLI